MVKKSKRCLTLIEVMICVAILATIAATMAFPLTGMLGRHRFHQGVKQFVIHVREMQALALNHHSDMGIMLYEEQGRLMCKGFTDEPLRLFRPFELQNISSLTFDQKPVKMPLKLTVFSSGRIGPASVLTFSKKGESVDINFKDSPYIHVEEKHASD
jgi:hypothetical protein